MGKNGLLVVVYVLRKFWNKVNDFHYETRMMTEILTFNIL